MTAPSCHGHAHAPAPSWLPPPPAARHARPPPAPVPARVRGRALRTGACTGPGTRFLRPWRCREDGKEAREGKGPGWGQQCKPETLPLVMCPLAKRLSGKERHVGCMEAGDKEARVTSNQHATHRAVTRSTSSWYALSRGATSRDTSGAAPRRNSGKGGWREHMGRRWEGNGNAWVGTWGWERNGNAWEGNGNVWEGNGNVWVGTRGWAMGTQWE